MPCSRVCPTLRAFGRHFLELQPNFLISLRVICLFSASRPLLSKNCGLQVFIGYGCHADNACVSNPMQQTGRRLSKIPSTASCPNHEHKICRSSLLSLRISKQSFPFQMMNNPRTNFYLHASFREHTTIQQAV